MRALARGTALRAARHHRACGRSAGTSAREGDFHQWIQYDLLYVRHTSFAVDLKILLATVLTGGGKAHVPLSWILLRERCSGRSPADRDALATRPPPARRPDAPHLIGGLARLRLYTLRHAPHQDRRHHRAGLARAGLC